MLREVRDLAGVIREVREMPVVFRVKADAPRDLESIVLTYSFLEVPRS